MSPSRRPCSPWTIALLPFMLSNCSDPGQGSDDSDSGAGGASAGRASEVPSLAAGSTSGGAAGSPLQGGAPAVAGAPAAFGGASAAGTPSSNGEPGSGGATQAGGAGATGGANGGTSAGMNVGGTPASSGSGGRGGSGGASLAGAPGAGGGAAGMSAVAGSGGKSDDETIATTIPTPTNGQGEIRNATTVLKNAKNGGKDVWDFGNQRIGVDNTADCDDGENQKTVFEVEDGVTVRNLIIAGGLAAGNGIVCKGNCTLEYVYWEDVCEDAATNSKDGATMTLNHVIALHASDKVFQHNAKGGSKTIIENSYIADFGKLWRSCGDCTANGGPRHLVLDNVRVDQVKTAVAGANQNYGDTVTISRLFVKGGYDAAKDKPRICTEYLGVTDHDGESTSLNGGKSQWNTTTCKVSQSNVLSW